MFDTMGTYIKDELIPFICNPSIIDDEKSPDVINFMALKEEFEEINNKYLDLIEEIGNIQNEIDSIDKKSPEYLKKSVEIANKSVDFTILAKQRGQIKSEMNAILYKPLFDVAVSIYERLDRVLTADLIKKFVDTKANDIVFQEKDDKKQIIKEALIAFFWDELLPNNPSILEQKAPTKYDNYFFHPIDKLSRNLSNVVENTIKYGNSELCLGKYKNNNIEITAMLETTEKMRLEEQEFDWLVLESISNLYRLNEEFTAADVFRQFLNKESMKLAGSKSPETMTADIENSIERLRKTKLTANLTELQNYKNVQLDSYTLDDYLLSVIRKKSISGGHVVTSYKFNSPPILARFSEQLKQIITIDRKHLTAPQNITKKSLLIRQYLLQEIDVIKNKNSKRSNNIRYDTMIEKLGLKSDSKIEKKRIRDLVKKYLDSWINTGYVKGYKENKEGNSFSSVTIIF